MVRMLATLALATVALTAAADAYAQTSLVREGQAIAVRMCAACHAVGRADVSPHVTAPPLRHLDRHVDLDTFGDRLRDGLLGPHAGMPMFRFSRDDAHAFVAYLRSIQGP
jgi:mono/diheme cytochrome c family protein